MTKNQIIKTENILDKISSIIEESRSKIAYSVNFIIVEAYWNIGKLIVEGEQEGQEKAEYGKYLLKNLSEELTHKFGKGFDARNLRHMRQFYLTYPNWNALRSELSWTHYRVLTRLEDENKRSFYQIETIENNWSTRELERQINSMLYERLALSKNKEEVLRLAKEGQIIQKPADIIKYPYVLEFTGIDQQEKYLEKDLEKALLKHIQSFIRELGKGFTFEASQKRISIGDKDFFIDLVFYNYLLRCFVLIDLKIGELTHQDLGQMQMYVNYYRRELMNEGDNPPVGIVLCAEKDDAVVEYTLPEDNKHIFASNYKLYLPTEEELKAELIREKHLLESIMETDQENDSDKPKGND